MNRNVLTILGVIVIIIALIFGVRFIRQSAIPVTQNNGNVYPVENPDYGNWVKSSISPQGIQFMHPESLPTKYITATEWPPKV